LPAADAGGSAFARRAASLQDSIFAAEKKA
jgi:hypothetical protein